MKKNLIVIATLFLGLLGLFMGFGYWQLKTKLPEILRASIEQAKSQGIDIFYQQVLPPQDSLIDLKDIKISGKKMAVSAQVDSFKIKVSFERSLHPIHILISLNHPSISKNSLSQETLPLQTGSELIQLGRPPTWLAVTLAIVPLKLVVTDIEAQPWGLNKADLMLKTLGTSVSGARSLSMSVDHQLILKEWVLSKWPLGPQVSTEGTLVLEYPQAKLSNGKVAIGPLRVQASGKFDFKSRKWSLDCQIPQSDLKEWSLSHSSQVMSGIKSAEGSLYLKTSSQGLGSDLNSIYTEGEIKAEAVRLTLDRPEVTGVVGLNMNSTFSRGEFLNLNGELDLNLDNTTIHIKQNFRKPNQIPLNLRFKVSGNNNRFLIEEGNVHFHNLKGTVLGTVLNGPKISTQLQASILRTSLQGWEQFLPSLSKIKTQGTVEGSLNYAGTLDDWKSASVDLLIKATEVEIPLLKEWLPSKEVNINGISKLNSETKVSFSQGALKTLITSTQINLTENHIAYSNWFLKDSGTPMSANLFISSNSKEARVKNSIFTLGGIRGVLEGKITNFSSPNGEFQLKTNSVTAKELLKLTPAAAENPIKILNGTVRSQISLRGPLLSKNKLPELKFGTRLSNFSLDYAPQPKEKPISIRAMEGEVQGNVSSGSLGELNIKPFQFSVFDGTVGVKVSCKGPLRTAKCSQSFKASKMAAGQLLEFMSPKAKGLLQGKFQASFEGEFFGISLDSYKKSNVGQGTFLFTDGNLSTVNLIEKPLESLKRFPLTANLINKVPKNQSIKETQGKFQLKDGRVLFSDLKMTSPLFDATSAALSVDMDQKVHSKVLWMPKESLLNKQILDMLRDESGKPSVVLMIEGPASQPSISLDESTLQSRLANYVKKQAEEKTNRALLELKKAQGNTIKEKLKKGLQGLFNH